MKPDRDVPVPEMKKRFEETVSGRDTLYHLKARERMLKHKEELRLRRVAAAVGRGERVSTSLPLPNATFDVGQCATQLPRSASSARSSSSR